ncbi:putative transposase, partial [Nocardioides psychrotolerans]
RSHSRPHVSNDNPYSEAAFKTLKYAPVFPTNFGSLQDARSFCETFFTYYNHDTVIPGSGCTPRHRSTTAPRSRSAPNAR